MLLLILGLDVVWCVVIEGLVQARGVPPGHPPSRGNLDLENISPLTGVNDLVLVHEPFTPSC